MMKNQNFVNSSMVSLEPWRVVFLEILFNPAKTYKTVEAKPFCNKKPK